MKRAMRRFVSKLTGRNRYIFLVVLILICIASLSIGIYSKFFYKYADTDPFMLGINIGAQKTAEEYDLLRSNFNEIFNNDLKGDDSEIILERIDSEKNIVYTAYNLVNEDETFYSVDTKIPMININSDVAKKINSQIKDEYYNKANSIMRQTEGNTIYKVTYEAYINNSNILSVVIKSSLKDENKSEKVSIKTYNYGIVSEELVTLQDLIDLKKMESSEIQKEIDKEIKKAYNDAKIIAAEYGELYERDLSNSMYKIENSENYFLTDDGYVYIVYPYGNNDYTNEMDIVIF